MTPLHRHQLAFVTDTGWQRVRHRAWDATARDCLAHWSEHRLPLVVTRQPPPSGGAPGAIALGLPAPARWGGRRITLDVLVSDVLYFDEFPRAEAIERLLPDAARAPWRRLCAGLAACGVMARVYGSYGWTLLSGLRHLRAGSDIDLWLAVSQASQADAAAEVLHAFGCAAPRLDGEFVFDGGTAVAWREWAAWRAGGVDAILARTLHGAALLRSLAGCGPCASAERVA